MENEKKLNNKELDVPAFLKRNEQPEEATLNIPPQKDDEPPFETDPAD